MYLVATFRRKNCIRESDIFSDTFIAKVEDTVSTAFVRLAEYLEETAENVIAIESIELTGEIAIQNEGETGHEILEDLAEQRRI